MQLLYRRITLVADIHSPGYNTLCYSAHLEVFCGLTGRVAQFSELLSHSNQSTVKFPYQLLFGDLNTMAHSIARLSPKFCRDQFRWQSLGYCESEWLWNYVLSWHVNDGPVNLKLASVLPSSVPNEQILTAARNPGLFDPWDPVEDITLDNPSYYGFYTAKLDWTLLRGFKVISKFKGNTQYSASDHLYLSLKLEPEEDFSSYEDSQAFHSKIPVIRSNPLTELFKKVVYGTCVLLCLYNHMAL